jgi:glycerol-3-phosphate dehydrogenase
MLDQHYNFIPPPNRPSRIDRASQEIFDLLIIGGGIHGVALAKIAAQSGLSVLLLEQQDYASGTSSRSSKMAHGGLRYLEMFDFEQVFEGIRAREALFDRLPNLVHPEKFLIPVPRGDLWLRIKLGVGLTIYDLLVRCKERRHKWLSDSAQLSALKGHRLSGCYQYTDGLMSDSRLVFEFLTAAQLQGCCALNYARVNAISKQSGGQIVVNWSDRLKDLDHTSRTRLVVNCAGPWAPSLHPVSANQSLPAVRYSRGSHLIFSVPWQHPALFLPLEDKGRYYFVWPHPSGTMVGTTEREVSELELDPLPSADEVEEILSRLKRDLPNSGLDRRNLHYAFAGVRTLPLRGSHKGVSQLSRKHIWSYADGVLTLLGGKYTTFAWTATEGFKLALARLGARAVANVDPLRGLPGAITETESDALIRDLASQHDASPKAVKRAVERLGSVIMSYVSEPRAWREIAPGVLMLEVLHAIDYEQAVTLEDILRRRIELEMTPSHGVELLDVIVAELRRVLTSSDLAQQKRDYLSRILRVERLLKSEVAPPA